MAILVERSYLGQNPFLFVSDFEWQNSLANASGSHCQGSNQEASGPGQDEEVGKPQKWSW